MKYKDYRKYGKLYKKWDKRIDMLEAEYDRLWEIAQSDEVWAEPNDHKVEVAFRLFFRNQDKLAKVYRYYGQIK